jgi:hypothetical protein
MTAPRHQIQLPETSIIGAGTPDAVDRATFQAEIDALRVREKAHTRVPARLLPA